MILHSTPAAGRVAKILSSVVNTNDRHSSAGCDQLDFDSIARLLLFSNLCSSFLVYLSVCVFSLIVDVAVGYTVPDDCWYARLTSIYSHRLSKNG